MSTSPLTTGDPSRSMSEVSGRGWPLGDGGGTGRCTSEVSTTEPRTPLKRAAWLLATVTLLLVASPVSAAGPLDTSSATASRTTRVSISSQEKQADGNSFPPSLSAGGRFIAFQSGATNLVAGDTNARRDVFVRDRQAGTTRRVSLSSAEHQNNGASGAPALSTNGRFVAFDTTATNLLSGDTNRRRDVVVRDRKTGTTSRVSLADDEGQGHGQSYDASISAGGRYVVFSSYASDLVPGDDNRSLDVFVRDTKLGTTTLVSVSTSGELGEVGGSSPELSSDGRYVAFQSFSKNLVAHDTNRTDDVFVRDLARGTTRRVSVSSSEKQASGGAYQPAISPRGRYVAFVAYSADLVRGDTNRSDDVFVRDRELGTTRRVSLTNAGRQANDSSQEPVISTQGRFVAFSSFASNLVLGDATRVMGRPEDVRDEDVFLRDRKLGTTRMASVSTSGLKGDWGSYGPAITSEGGAVAFSSYAKNLVRGDTNNAYDVFVWRR